MAALTIRGLDEAVKQELRRRAARHGNSMEEEARRILREAVGKPLAAARAETGADLFARIRARLAGVADEPLEVPPRDLVRDPPRFE